MKTATAILIALQALAALGMFALSVHGPTGLALAAPLYLAVAAGLTWWASRRSWWLLGATGVAMLAAAPGLYALLDAVEQAANRRRIAATQVADVRDEPILLADKAVGVRLFYQVSAPAFGYFAILPALQGSAPADGFGLQPRRWTFDGRGGIEFGPFEPGKRHAVMVELYPESFVLEQAGVACARRVSRPLPQAWQPAPLRVEIYESPYGSVLHGGRDEVTRGSYDIATLYHNVAAVLPACKAGP